MSLDQHLAPFIPTYGIKRSKDFFFSLFFFPLLPCYFMGSYFYFFCPQGSLLHFSTSFLHSFTVRRLKKSCLFSEEAGHTEEQLLPISLLSISETLNLKLRWLSSSFLFLSGIWESKGLVIAPFCPYLMKREGNFK